MKLPNKSAESTGSTVRTAGDVEINGLCAVVPAKVLSELVRRAVSCVLYKNIVYKLQKGHPARNKESEEQPNQAKRIIAVVVRNASMEFFQPVSAFGFQVLSIR